MQSPSVYKIFVMAGAGIIGLFFNTWTDLSTEIHILLYTMIADVLLGVIAGAIARSLSPQIMFEGILRKAAILILVAFSWIVQKELPANQPIAPVITMFFAGYEFMSACKNFIKTGVPLPDWVVNLFKIFEPTLREFKTKDEGDEVG